MFDAGAGAIVHDGSPKIQRHNRGAPADHGGCALYCFIRNVKDNKLFASLGCGNVVIATEHHEISSQLPVPDTLTLPPPCTAKENVASSLPVRLKTSPTHTGPNP
jgi:hypothetical protein